MTKFKYAALAATFGLPAAALLAMPAQAQVAGIAVADPTAVILSAKALDTANEQINTSYKPQLDQVKTREAALQTELNGIKTQLDTNHDGTVSPAELQAAQAAKNPALDRFQTARDNGQKDLARLNAPMERAQAYAIEQITEKYPAAMNTVVAAKHISLLLSADQVLFTQPANDVSDDIKTEIDRTTPSVSIAPPANWQPSQQTQSLQQQFQQLMYAQAVRAAQQQGAAPGAPAAPVSAAPATGKKKPTER
jgi:Skp family chaperone for outer membrane proteins